MLISKSAFITMLFISLVQNVSSEVSVMVYSKDEGLHEHNISKPRIVIENTGTEPVSDFYCLYYFTTENGKLPVIEDYYTPNGSVSLLHMGHNKYAVRYDFSGVTLYPGETFPSSDGNVIGIHYPNWEPLCKENDLSCSLSSDFVPNHNIPVIFNNERVYCERQIHHKHTKKKVPPKRASQVSINVDIDL